MFILSSTFSIKNTFAIVMKLPTWCVISCFLKLIGFWSNKKEENKTPKYTLSTISTPFDEIWSRLYDIMHLFLNKILVILIHIEEIYRKIIFPLKTCILVIHIAKRSFLTHTSVILSRRLMQHSKISNKLKMIPYNFSNYLFCKWNLIFLTLFSLSLSS